MRLVLYLFTAVLSIPLVEVVALTLIWRESLTHPWFFAVVGCIVAYAIAAGVLLAAQKHSESGGWDFTGGDFLKRARAATNAKPSGAPFFDRFTLLVVELLSTVLILNGLTLWALRSLFVSANP